MAKPFPQTIAEAQGSFLEGLSPLTVVKACLDRIQEQNDRLRALIFIAGAEALEEAQQAEAAIRAGKPIGPLHGIPVAVKDMIDVRDWQTTGGSRLFEKDDALSDARCVANLRSAGATMTRMSNWHT